MSTPGDSDPSQQAATTTTALEAMMTAAAASQPRARDEPRRCFICLTDEHPSDPPGSWVDACPCTLTAHQDCAQSWVIDCERSGTPLRCPVCKYKVELVERWDPVVKLSDAVGRRFSRATPLLLVTGVSMGVHLCLHAYGVMALWAFAGQDAAIRYVQGRQKLPGRTQSFATFARDRVGGSMILINVAPALLLGHLLPGFSNRIFMPTASLYGMWHAMHDEYFFTWPPSPQLAMVIFPYIRSAYYNMWKEFVYPYESKLNRQILGLPEVRQDGDRGNNRQQNDRNDRNADRNADRNRDGGIITNFLQTIIDALDADDEEAPDDGAFDNVRVVDEQVELQVGNGEGGEVVVEVVIEQAVEVDEEQEEAEEVVPIDIAGLPPAPRLQPVQPDRPAQGAANPVPPVAEQPDQQGDHEVPPARAARRPGLGTILSSVSNSITSALIMPGVSYAMGEVLRMLLPTKWTAGALYRHGPLGRPGLLHERWGRSLLGGCLFVVMKDAIRLYVKYRKASAMMQRRIKNVDRKRLRRS